MPMKEKLKYYTLLFHHTSVGHSLQKIFQMLFPLILNMLGKTFIKEHFEIFVLFSETVGIFICELSPMETIQMKGQIWFSLPPLQKKKKKQNTIN